MLFLVYGRMVILMKIILFDYDSKKEIRTFSFNSKGDKSFSSGLNALCKKQSEEDILGLGRTGWLEREGFGLGISEYLTRGTMYSSLDIVNFDSFTSKEDLLFKDEITKPTSTLKFREDDGKITDTGKKVIAVGYEEGLVINVGKYIYSHINSKSNIPGYFEKVSSNGFIKRVHWNSIGKAKIFKTPLEVTKYVKNHQEYFEILDLSIEYTNNLFKEDVSKFSNKKRSSWDSQMAVLENFVSSLMKKAREKEERDRKEREVPSEATAENMREEAFSRMGKLSLSDDVISNFRNDKLLMSFGGKLLALDNNAKKAIELAKEKGLLPYHVIRTSTTFGELYDVLYVSDDVSNWIYERLLTGRDDLYSYCYNATYPECSEIGDIAVSSVNGVLERDA